MIGKLQTRLKLFHSFNFLWQWERPGIWNFSLPQTRKKNRINWKKQNKRQIYTDMCLAKLSNIRWNRFLAPVVLSRLSRSMTVETIFQGHTTIPLIRWLGLLHTTWMYEEYFREQNFRSIDTEIRKQSQNVLFITIGFRTFV